MMIQLVIELRSDDGRVTFRFARGAIRGMLQCNEAAGDHQRASRHRHRPRCRHGGAAGDLRPTRGGPGAADGARAAGAAGRRVVLRGVAALAAGGPMPEMPPALAAGALLALRCSPEERAWGGASAMLNIGLCDRTAALLGQRIGATAALGLYPPLRAGLRPRGARAWTPRPSTPSCGGAALEPAAIRDQLDDMLALFEAETDHPWPQDPAEQLDAAARAMARAWNAASARILRQAKGAPEDAGLGLVVQRMALGVGPGVSGSGHLQLVNGRTGAPEAVGDFRPPGARQRRPGSGAQDPRPLAAVGPEALAVLEAAATRGDGGARRRLPARVRHRGRRGRHPRRAAGPPQRPRRRPDRGRSRQRRRHHPREALLRIEPRSLIEHLHPQIDPAAPRDVFGTRPRRQPGRRDRAHRLHRRGGAGRGARTSRRSSCASRPAPRTSAACTPPAAC